MNTKALYKMSYGMYVVSSKKEGRFNGQIANTVFQVTSEPAAIAVCINKQNLTFEFINSSNAFTVSVLSVETPMQYIGRFGFKSGRDSDKFKDINYKIGTTGIPTPTDYSIACYEAEVVNRLDAGTHVLFIGKITDAEILGSAEPMTYAYYHEIKGGKSPKTAPTYHNQEKRMEGTAMKKYQCTVCGYIYDPEKGDPEGGIKPGTAFEQLPGEWKCPICGAPKSAFDPVP